MKDHIAPEVDKLLAKVMAMETQQAFDFLEQTDADPAVVNRVAFILKPSHTRTDFLQSRGLVNWLASDIDADNDLSGQSIANIKLEKVIGQGGMGTVYKGTDLLLERTVAVKTLKHKHKNKNNQAQERFRREALLLSKMDHPNICRIHSLIETDQTDYLVLEYIIGQALTQDIFASFSKSTQINIITQILLGLQAAHRQNIIHRDIKPDNIMITNNGVIKILDFGISRFNNEESLPATGTDEKVQSKHTVEGSVMGTLRFMSPEQAAGDEITTASDMYSFGLLLQTLLSKVSPYPSSTTAEQLLKLTNQGQTQIPNDLPHYWVKVIQSLISLAPADRPTAKATLALVENIQAKPKKRMRITGLILVMLLSTFAISKYITDLKYERQQALLAQQKSEQVVRFLSSMFQQANPYGAQGEEFSAIDLLTQGSQRIEEELKTQSDAKAYLKAIIGDSFMQLGNVKLAENIINQAYQEVLTNQEISQDTRLMVKEIQSSFLMNIAKIEEAGSIIEQLLTEVKADDTFTLTRLKVKQALVYVNLNKFDDAIKLSQETLKLIAKEGSEYDEFKAHFYNQLGICHFYLGKYEAAKNHFLSGVTLVENSSENFNGTDMQLLDGLSSSYLLIGDQENSTKVALKTIKVAEKLLPENHIDLARIYNNMSIKFLYVKNYPEAKVWSDKSIIVFETNFNSGQMNDDQVIPLYASTLIAQGNILSKMDQKPLALEKLLFAKTKIQKIFPYESMEMANVEFEIALVRWQIDQSDKLASFHLSESLKIFAQINQTLVGKHLSAQELKIAMQKQTDKEKASITLLQIIDQLSKEANREADIQKISEKFKDLIP